LPAEVRPRFRRPLAKANSLSACCNSPSALFNNLTSAVSRAWYLACSAGGSVYPPHLGKQFVDPILGSADLFLGGYNGVVDVRVHRLRQTRACDQEIEGRGIWRVSLCRTAMGANMDGIDQHVSISV
jgi:hypothetical protein